MNKKPKTVEEFMALPIFGSSSIELVSGDNCQVVFRGQVINTSEPRQKVCIPVMPGVLAYHAEPDDIIGAGGWFLVLTDDGQWMRR